MTLCQLFRSSDLSIRDLLAFPRTADEESLANSYITTMMDQIRDGWSAHERERRRTAMPNALFAGIIKTKRKITHRPK